MKRKCRGLQCSAKCLWFYFHQLLYGCLLLFLSTLSSPFSMGSKLYSKLINFFKLQTEKCNDYCSISSFSQYGSAVVKLSVFNLGECNFWEDTGHCASLKTHNTNSSAVILKACAVWNGKNDLKNGTKKQKNANEYKSLFWQVNLFDLYLVFCCVAGKSCGLVSE